MKSSVALILSAHLPYLRAAGRSHAGEEPIHELLAYTLIPTLNSLYDLRDLHLPVHIGLAYSPILLEQLADPVVLKHFGFWLDERLAQFDAALATAEQTGETERVYLARFFREWCEGIRHSFDERFGLNPIAALRQLCEDGLVEPLAGAASSPRLNSIGRSAALRAQIELGALAVTRTLGTHPHGFWSPALEYRRDADTVIGASGMHYILCDTPPHHPWWLVPHRLAAISRDKRFDPYLIDPDLSYAGDPLYLDPTPDADRPAQTRNPIGQRRAYDPYDAYRRVLEHAGHFADVLAAQLVGSTTPISVLTLDAQTIGADWFEGAAWLRALLERLANHQQLELTTPAAWLRTAHLDQHQIIVARGEAQTPLGGMSSLQRTIQAAEIRLSSLAQRLPDADGEHERVLDQAARELLLAQSNDLAAGSSYEAPRRAMRHLVRCVQLCDLAERATFDDTDLTLLETFEQEDNSFAFLNYRMFAQ